MNEPKKTPRKLRPMDAVRVDPTTIRIVALAYRALTGRTPVWTLQVAFTREGDTMLHWTDDGIVSHGAARGPLHFLSVGEFLDGLIAEFPPLQPLRYEKWPVEFRPGSVTIGCTTVANDVVRRVLSAIDKPSDVRIAQPAGILVNDCVTIADPELRKWVLGETTRRTGMPAASANTARYYPGLVVHNGRVCGASIAGNEFRQKTVPEWLALCDATHPPIPVGSSVVGFKADSVMIGEHEVTHALVREIAKRLVDEELTDSTSAGDDPTGFVQDRTRAI